MSAHPGDDPPARHVLVLGAGSDIGVGIARALVADRAGQVVLAARAPDDLGLAARDLEVSGAVGVTTVRFDASDLDGIGAAVEAAVALLPRLDVAVVAFGMFVTTDQLAANPDQLVEMVSVNYVAAVACGRVLADHLRRQGGGTIVALSSKAALVHRPDNYAYASAKAGMDRYFVGLGEELAASGGRVLVVRPAGVRTKSVPLGPGALEPADVGRAVVNALGASRLTPLSVEPPRRQVRRLVGRVRASLRTRCTGGGRRRTAA